jgi:sigma-B regulation protein RsbU (phosphoserine phosphatase)
VFSGQTYLDGLPLTCGDSSIDEPVDMAPDSSFSGPIHIPALKAVKLTNNYIALNHGDLAMFATLFFGILDPDSGSLSYISGGHEPLFIIDSGGGVKSHLSFTGPAVGIEPNMEFEIQQANMAPGDILLGYTDGVTEAVASDGSFFTTDRLMSILEVPAPTAKELLDRIANNLQEHVDSADQFDDITMLAVRRISR